MPSQNSSGRLTIVLVVVIIAIIAGAGGYYFYSSALHSTTSQISTATDQSGFVYAKFVTSQVKFEAELFNYETTKTVENFVSLSNSGF